MFSIKVLEREIILAVVIIIRLVSTAAMIDAWEAAGIGVIHIRHNDTSIGLPGFKPLHFHTQRPEDIAVFETGAVVFRGFQILKQVDDPFQQKKRNHNIFAHGRCSSNTFTLMGS